MKIAKLSLHVAAVGDVTASTETRTLAGELVRFGVRGRTSRGPLRVRAGALRFPEDIARVKLTREHDRAASRGYCSGIQVTASGIRASTKVSDGPDGDDALREAKDGTRNAFSFDVVDATVVGDEITDALVIAIGQVGIPAYEDSRIDTIAAAAANTGGNIMLSPEQAQRLLELQARIDNGETLAEEEQREYDALKVLSALQHSAPEGSGADAPVTASAADQSGGVHVHVHNGPAPQPGVEVAASVPTPPAGAPGPAGSSTSTSPQGGAFGKFCADFAEALGKTGTDKLSGITAALADITYSSHAGNIQQPEWSGELWSGLEYTPEFLDLFTEGTMTSLNGTGWRFTDRLEIKDYAGDKAEIPTDNIATAIQNWSGARMAVGVDIDRAFFDFPTPGFVESLFQQVRESWKIKLDAKVKAYVVTNATAAAVDENAGVPVAIGAQAALLKAVAVAVRSLKRRRVGGAAWVLVSDDDMFTLIDTKVEQTLAYLKLFGVEPENFRSTSQLAAGTVYAGVKQAAKLRVMPGSPIRVDAQRLANGGVDEAFFGYWAIEKQHTKGIAKATFTP